MSNKCVYLKQIWGMVLFIFDDVDFWENVPLSPSPALLPFSIVSFNTLKSLESLGGREETEKHFK